MAAVPVILNGVFMPSAKDANSQPVKGTFLGYLSIEGLQVGGGPIIPPGVTPPDPPIDVPPDQPGPQIAVVVKPAPVTGGWGIATDSSGGSFQWFFTPGPATPGPKRTA